MAEKKYASLESLVTLVSKITEKFAAKAHTHDDRYYTESEINSKVSTLQSSIDGKAAASHSHTAATASVPGFMSASDKSKLDGVASGAQANQNAFSNVKVGETTVAADNTTDTLTLAGSNVTLTPDATNDKVTIGITKANVVSALGYTPPTTDTDVDTTYSLSKDGNTITLNGSDGSTSVVTDSNTTYSEATTSTAGLMSAADKTKLNGVAAGAQVNQNAFSNVKVGDVSVAADTATDTLTLVAGSNVTLTPDAANDKITIAATDTKYNLGSFGVTATAAELNYTDGVTSNIQSQLDGKAASGHSHTEASESAPGFMSTADKTKLNSIAANAQVNQNTFSNVKVGDKTIAADTATDTLTLAGSNVTLTPDATNDKVTIGITKANVVAALGYTPPTTDTNTNTTYSLTKSGSTITLTGSDGTTTAVTDSNTTYSDVTQSAHGLMTANDKKKLDGIASGAQVNQNAFSNVKVGEVSVAADNVTDTLTLVAGSNVTITPDETNDKITIAATDTKYNLSSFGITATAAELNKLDGVTATTAEINHVDGVTSNIQTQLDAKVPTSRTVNGKALSGNISLSAADVGADASGTAETKASAALSSSRSYTDTKIADLINSAPETLDTLGEIATAMSDNADVVSALNDAVGTKANASDLTAHTGNKSNPHGVTKAQVGLGNVENKSSATIRGELTKANVTTALGYTPPTTNTTYNVMTGATADAAGSSGLTPVPAKGAANRYLRSDGTWSVPPDNNTTYGAAGDNLGLVKSGGDVTIASGVITVKDDSHNHTIANVDGLQSALDGKAASSHTHNYAGSSSAGGAATSANKLATGRTISLTGDVSGSTTFDGSGNVSITATVADDSHNHTIANVDGLQTALDGKSANGHTHTSLAFKGNVGATQDWDTLADGVWTVGQSQAFSETYHQPVGAYSYGMLRVYSNGSNITQIYTAHQNGQMWFRQRFSSDNNFTPWGRTYTTVSKPSAADIGAANASHNHSAGNITSGTLSADRLPTVPASKGGTGQTSLTNSANVLINSLSTGSSTPSDADYYVSQYAGGGTTTTTYHRRPVSALWSYIKGKADTVYAAKSHGNHVPATQTANNAKFLRNDNTWQTVTPANIGAAASSHNHSAANITSGTLGSDRLPTVPITKGGTGSTTAAGALTNLGITATATELNYVDGATSNIQAQLNSKAASGHTHNYAGSASAGGAATSANKLATARTISLTTGATGSANFDGSANANISVTNLREAYLTWGGKNITGGITPIDAATSNIHSANRFAFANPAGIKIEYSTNGSTYSTYSTSDAEKIAFVSGIGKSYLIGARGTGTTANDKLRITLNASNMGVYTRLQKLLINVSTNYASGSNVIIEKAMKGSETTFSVIGTYNLSGWSGWNSIPFGGVPFGGGSNQTGNIAVLRLTFGITGVNSSQTNNALNIIDIAAIGDTYWAYPSDMAKTGHLYNYDANKNATFPAKVSATSFTGSFSASDITSGTLSNDRLSTVPISKGGTGATTAAAALTNLGISATAAELNYVDGVTSNIQTQLNGKAASGHTHNYAGSSSAGGAANSSNVLNSNTRMDYGWNGVNYFNLSGTAGNAAKVNDTPTTAWWHIMRFNHANSTGFYTDLAIPFNATGIYYKRITSGNVNNGGWVPVLDSLNYTSYVPTKTGSGASGTWGISITGNAATATKLGTANKGSATQPIYLAAGVPTACTYTLGKSVPSNAVFTDTKTPKFTDDGNGNVTLTIV